MNSDVLTGALIIIINLIPFALRKTKYLILTSALSVLILLGRTFLG